MLFKEFIFVLVFNFVLKPCVGSRRIVGGMYTAFDKRYMVYFVKSNYTKPKIPGPNVGDYWLCGGAIVSPTQILTSAACLLENNNIYAIAGYRKYVKTHDLEHDECTRRWKQRVVKICIPKDYEFDYAKPIQWLSMDVGVAIVENPYDFSNLKYRLHCSYVPAPVKILYEEIYQSEGNDVQMLGWGHVKARQPHNIKDLNSLYLREASGMIQPKSHCRTKFHKIILEELIDKYLICVHHKGNIGGDGEVLHIGDTSNAGCMRRNIDPTDPRCSNDTSTYDDDYFDFRRNSNKTGEFETTRGPNASSHDKILNTRRQGICQNDHGGPLITWVGKEEVLIGVALTALLSDTYECIGPYIFTSAYCASMIIQCLLISNTALRTACEDKTKEKGFKIEEKAIEWGDVDSERKPAETDIKARQVDSLHFRDSVKEVPPQAHQPSDQQPISYPHVSLQPLSKVHSQPHVPVRSKPYIHSEPQPRVHSQPSVLLNQPQVYPQPNIRLRPQPQVHTQLNVPLRPEPNILLQPRHPSLHLQTNVISQPHAPLRPQPHMISHPHVPSAPKSNMIFNKISENNYAKIRNVGF